MQTEAFLSFSVLHVKGSPLSSPSMKTLRSVEVVITDVHAAHTIWSVPFFHVWCYQPFPIFQEAHQHALGPLRWTVERVSCLKNITVSNSAMSDWGSVITGFHVIFCSQPSNLQKTEISVAAVQQECWIRLLLVCLWFHIEDTVIVLVLISRGIYDKVYEIWRMEHVKQYIPILPDGRLCSLLSSFRQWPSQPLPDKKGQHFHHRGQIPCLHVGHDRNCN